ncbi:metallophosphoesterase [Blastococcus sp. SYSU DS0510]
MKRWLVRIGIAVGVLVVLLLVYGVLIEPRLILDEERADVPIAQLDDDLAGTEVAVIADFQIGMWWGNPGMSRRAVETAVAAEPDVVLLGGDFLYSSTPDIEPRIDTVLELLEPLRDSGIPAFAVLGNHDYAIGAVEELITALEEHGTPVLRNEAEPVPGLAGDLFVVGLGPAKPNRVDIDAALADVPDGAPRVVLMHNPTTFPDLPPGSAPLALAGHTHCGQIALPGAPRWTYMGLTSEEEIVADGWAPDGYGAQGNRMFVTCGTGFSIAPIRINAPPQVAFFELQPEA